MFSSTTTRVWGRRNLADIGDNRLRRLKHGANCGTGHAANSRAHRSTDNRAGGRANEAKSSRFHLSDLGRRGTRLSSERRLRWTDGELVMEWQRAKVISPMRARKPLLERRREEIPHIEGAQPSDGSPFGRRYCPSITAGPAVAGSEAVGAGSIH